MKKTEAQESKVVEPGKVFPILNQNMPSEPMLSHLCINDIHDLNRKQANDNNET
jgi:hypothetical protein